MNDNNNEYWIPVTPSSGMFSSEYAISLELASGQKVSFFLDKGMVKEAAGRYLMKVVLVNNYPDQNKKLVLLPTETFETASRWVEVAT
jgi:S-formylglutathione hydrolase FrmB